MDTLRSLLAGRTPRVSTGATRAPRTGTKQETVLALLRRDEGASGPQIAEATGWAAHTVRGFLAGLKKKGFTIETLDRVRMVGPSKEGTKGSYSVYRITG
jgi:biotin operon repressor